MFGIPPPSSPSLPQTPVLPFLPQLGFPEGLNLSPSLLTSPTRGLTHTLIPEGQEELQGNISYLYILTTHFSTMIFIVSTTEHTLTYNQTNYNNNNR